MQAVYFTLVGIVLYVGSDWLLRRLERTRGRPFEHRSIVFFCILLSSALATFAVIRSLTE